MRQFQPWLHGGHVAEEHFLFGVAYPFSGGIEQSHRSGEIPIQLQELDILLQIAQVDLLPTGHVLRPFLELGDALYGQFPERPGEQILRVIQGVEGVLYLAVGDEFAALVHLGMGVLDRQGKSLFQGEQLFQFGRPLHEAVQGHGTESSG